MTVAELLVEMKRDLDATVDELLIVGEGSDEAAQTFLTEGRAWLKQHRQRRRPKGKERLDRTRLEMLLLSEPFTCVCAMHGVSKEDLRERLGLKE
jgi:hypothetical protein